MNRQANCASTREWQCWCLSVMATLLIVLCSGANLQAEQKDGAIISEVSGLANGDAFEVRIKGNSDLAYTSYELFNPIRVVVDLANAHLQPGVTPNLPANTQIKVQTTEITDAQPQILRIEFLLEKSLPYTARLDGNTVLVNFNLKEQGDVKTLQTSTIPTANSSPSALEKHFPDATSTAAVPAGAKMQDDFSFSGYDRERISVDFYKMDLHNVFRFLREISGTNMIVDEAVQGTLTLTLDNVPWDFALDVIMNLKDLRREERFNTIVIYPKDKEFAWPGKAESSLSFQADEDMAQQEALVITQMEEQPVGLVEATQLIAKGREFEKQHNPAMAVQSYEQAFEKWNSNSKLANKISAIYLVDLRQNAKALHYAKQALAVNKKDSVASLNAAIAAANMRDMQTAQFYFDQSTQMERPSQEALLSYALFCEEGRQYDQAVQVLNKHDTLYGKTLDTMIAKARILDKKGASAQALQEYRSIISSGFTLPPDLSRFIRARIGMVN